LEYSLVPRVTNEVAVQSSGREAQMYQFSRSIYRELGSDVIDVPGAGTQPNRERFLRAC
jgi:hypothetical protein